MKKLFTIIVQFFIVTTVSFAYINMSPTSFDKNIKNGGYQEFTLYNNTTIPIRYRIEPMKMEKKNVGDMSQWIDVYPKVVTINPADEQIFKVYIKSPSNANEGDYGAFLNIKQISAPKLKDKQDEIAAGMIVMINLNMGLYGYVSTQDLTLDASTPKLFTQNEKVYLSLELTNKSNRLGRVKIEAKESSNRFYPIGEIRLMANEKVILNNEIKELKNKKNIREIIITDVENNKILNTIKV